MKICTWNINGIKARLEVLTRWLGEAQPDLVCLQEIKSIDENFPREHFEALGYQVETHGQKGFNGVAILSKVPLEDIERGLPGDDSDEQARFIVARAMGKRSSVRVAGLYLPNGNPVESEKFPYKLAWMDRLIGWSRDQLLLEEPLVITGDFNIIPAPDDCHDPKSWWGDALYRPESLAKFREMAALGFTDAIRNVMAEEAYTFWDFQAGAWPRNHGIRIDHFMLSGQAADCLQSAHIDRYVRDWVKPSDHVPVCIELDI